MKTRTTIIIAVVLCIIIGLYGVNMIYFSMKPAQFVLPSSTEGPAGLMVADTLARLMEHELNGPGGWLPNGRKIRIRDQGLSAMVGWSGWLAPARWLGDVYDRGATCVCVVCR